MANSATGGGATADDTQFYDVGNANDHLNNGTPLTEEEREQLQQELKKTEDEISTLRQVLAARLKHSNELKRKLGVTPWVEVQQDISTAYKKTGEAFHEASDALSKKLGQIRSSNTFKSFEDRMGTAYNSVKAKIAASTSIDQLAGQKKSTSTTPGTQPTTPSTEKPSSPQ